MNKELTFDAMLESIAALGSEEKRIIEAAKDVSSIINAIAERRILAGLTQRQLADMCGVKQSAIARMESLRAIPRLDTLVKVARCLNCSLRVENISDSVVGDNVIYMSDYRNKAPYHWASSGVGIRKVEYHGTLG